ncbi:Vesicle transport v-SNARE N-terminal [Arabidopsis thaliana x Arabidopsis arenosa]|uniref:Vesicle transport v-SNARE N-terminal n=1 Tax=Arabidopsis thaliana x Arabidopsis arenosa TaxID=1240361 RepID=A0A8T1ZMN8_9BRAS|nr:Vesicle transport v-SNARE N-terminal [Arabidopsis thaliana x Arabidopsis arenosa]
MKNSLKGRPVQAPIFEGKEPPQFVALFNIWLSLRMTKKGSSDGISCTYSISGTGVHNNKALQVEAIWKVDLEAKSLQLSAKALYLSKLKECKSDLNQLKKELKRVLSSDTKQSRCGELMKYGIADLHAVSADQRRRLAMSVKRLDQSRNRVRESRRLMLETAEIQGISRFGLFLLMWFVLFGGCLSVDWNLAAVYGFRVFTPFLNFVYLLYFIFGCHWMISLLTVYFKIL